ncbi:hypothetical protein F2P79_004440 [Pimephales promelas]|nr:hypothetical protein F2P79_004440 [Pimephales promelas]
MILKLIVALESTCETGARSAAEWIIIISTRAKNIDLLKRCRAGNTHHASQAQSSGVQSRQEEPAPVTNTIPVEAKSVGQ